MTCESPLAGRTGGAVAIAAAAAAIACPACPSTAPSTRAAPVETGYVEWISRRAWRLDDLPAVAAALDEICERAGRGDPAALGALPGVSMSMFVVREHLLPLLRSLPGSEPVPSEDAVAGRCGRPQPADGEFDRWRMAVATGAPAFEEGEGGRGFADDARFLRVVAAAAPVAAAGGPRPSTELVESVALLSRRPDSAHDDPEAVWVALAAEALAASDGAEALAAEVIDPMARDALAARGYLLLIARALRPVAEDAGSHLRLLAVELLQRLAAAWEGGE